MGLFTTIEHPIDGRDVQIHIGQDELDRYKIGDKIKWQPTKWNVGFHPDGIYDGCSYPDKDAWVVIRELTVVHVEDIEESEVWEDVDLRLKQWHKLNEQFPAIDPPRSLWKEEWWEEKQKQKAKKELEAHIKTQNWDALVAPLQNALNTNESVKRILEIKEIE